LNLATAAFQAVAGLIQRTNQSRRVFTGLISSYLASLLWLIDRQFFSLAQSGFGANAVVFAVLSTLSRAVAEPPLIAYVEDAEGQLDKIDQQHPLQKLIKSPTPGLMTQYELWELMVLYMGIAGRFNAFIE
jgi:phage portal protein BeeE